MGVWYYKIWEKLEDGTIAIDHLSTKDIIANELTKVLIPAKMKTFIE